MARPALRIKIPAKDRKQLRELLSGGVQQVRVVFRALALSQLAKGVSAPRISAVVPLTARQFAMWRTVTREAASNAPSTGKSARTGAPETLDDRPGPSGVSLWSAVTLQRVAPAWTVRLVVNRSGEAPLHRRSGTRDRPHPAVHHDLKPWREENVVRGRPQ